MLKPAQVGPLPSRSADAPVRWDLLAYPAFVFAAWVAAWGIDLGLRNAFAWGGNADTIYWIAMKAALWAGPVIVLLKREGIPVIEFTGLVTPLRGIAIGTVAGLGLLVFSFAMDAVLGGASFNIPVVDGALVNALLAAPVIEEFAMRGYYLTALERAGLPFGKANVRVGIFFVAMHLPGWYFQGRLRSPLSLIQTALFLWLLSLLLGWIKKTSGSLYAPMVVHILNNVYAAARG